MNINGWKGVVLDGGLAKFENQYEYEHIGEPIWDMIETVKEWLEDGQIVKVVTWRAEKTDGLRAVEDWCERHIGQSIPVTSSLDMDVEEIYGSICVELGRNTGIPVRPDPVGRHVSRKRRAEARQRRAKVKP